MNPMSAETLVARGMLPFMTLPPKWPIALERACPRVHYRNFSRGRRVPAPLVIAACRRIDARSEKIAVDDHSRWLRELRSRSRPATPLVSRAHAGSFAIASALAAWKA